MICVASGLLLKIMLARVLGRLRVCVNETEQAHLILLQSVANLLSLVLGLVL